MFLLAIKGILPANFRGNLGGGNNVVILADERKMLVHERFIPVNFRITCDSFDRLCPTASTSSSFVIHVSPFFMFMPLQDFHL